MSVAWQNLFATDYGLMSLAVIVFMIGMAIYFARLFIKLANEKPGEESRK